MPGDRNGLRWDCARHARCPETIDRACALDRLAADDPAHRGIAPEPVGVVDILLASETPIDGLAKETCSVTWRGAAACPSTHVCELLDLGLCHPPNANRLNPWPRISD